MKETINNEEYTEASTIKTVSRLVVVLLRIIAFLLILNLGATGYLIYQFQQISRDEIASTIESLPTELSSEEGREFLFESFISIYNEHDNDSLFALFDPLAREELTKEQVDQQLSILYQLTGKINSGTFSHYESVGVTRGREWFELNYRIQTDNGVGTLTITIAQEGQGTYEIWGFNIYIGR